MVGHTSQPKSGKVKKTRRPNLMDSYVYKERYKEVECEFFVKEKKRVKGGGSFTEWVGKGKVRYLIPIDQPIDADWGIAFRRAQGEQKKAGKLKFRHIRTPNRQKEGEGEFTRTKSKPYISR